MKEVAATTKVNRATISGSLSKRPTCHVCGVSRGCAFSGSSGTGSVEIRNSRLKSSSWSGTNSMPIATRDAATPTLLQLAAMRCNEGDQVVADPLPFWNWLKIERKTARHPPTRPSQDIGALLVISSPESACCTWNRSERLRSACTARVISTAASAGFIRSYSRMAGSDPRSPPRHASISYQVRTKVASRTFADLGTRLLQASCVTFWQS
jgi:hypothetical protein